MQLADREEQIIRIQSQSFQSELTAELEATLKLEVVGITQATIEAALVEELEAERSRRSGAIPRRSGYFSRVLDTEYGRIDELQVPKLRWGNILRTTEGWTFSNDLDSLF